MGTDNETRRTEENGFIKADIGKLDFSLVCPYAMEDLVKQLTIGAKKYSKDNWQKGDIFTYLSALERHINTVKKGLESGDYSMLTDDTGVNQCGALMFNSMAIGWFIRKGKIPVSTFDKNGLKPVREVCIFDIGQDRDFRTMHEIEKTNEINQMMCENYKLYIKGLCGANDE